MAGTAGRYKGAGTNVRRKIDTRRVAEGLKMVGIDPRWWVSYATVGTVDDDGNFDHADPQAIRQGIQGLDVDVLLEPLGAPVTCHYAGIHAGPAVFITAPIRSGDRVLVNLPDGDFGGPPAIIQVLSSMAVPVPLEGGLPIAKNDRLFIWAQDVPIDIRTAGGAHVEIDQDGVVNLNEGDKGVARLDDATETTFGGSPGAAGATQADAIAALAATSDLGKLISAIFASGVFLPSGLNVIPPLPDVAAPGVITAASGTVKAGG